MVLLHELIHIRRFDPIVGASQENWRKNAIARRLNMILKHKKSNTFHVLFGVMLVLVVAAVGLTKAKENMPSPNPETKTQSVLPRDFVGYSIGGGMPVTTSPLPLKRCG